MATFWQPPDEDFWQELRSGMVDEQMQNNSAIFQNVLPPLAALQSYYTRTFAGTGRNSVLPVESIYKRWTDDPTSRLPIAGSTGYLMGDPALHVQYLMDHYGLVVPPDYRMMPDHLMLLLELAAFLMQERSSLEVLAFISQHLDWLDKFELALSESSTETDADILAKVFYQLALQVLQKTVAGELMKYSTDKKENS